MQNVPKKKSSFNNDMDGGSITYTEIMTLDLCTNYMIIDIRRTYFMILALLNKGSCFNTIYLQK